MGYVAVVNTTGQDSLVVRDQGRPGTWGAGATSPAAAAGAVLGGSGRCGWPSPDAGCESGNTDAAADDPACDGWGRSRTSQADGCDDCGGGTLHSDWGSLWQSAGHVLCGRCQPLADRAEVCECGPATALAHQGAEGGVEVPDAI